MENRNQLHILGLIQARAGSKSIPQKSIAPLGGKPLMYYTIRAAQESGALTRLMISTDDPEMASVAASFGVEVPFLRPQELAQDTTPDLPVYEHALALLRAREGYIPDMVVQLRPTIPFKSATGIAAGVKMLTEHKEADSVRSMCVPTNSPFKMATVGADGYLSPFLAREFPEVFAAHGEPFNMPRQMLPAIWRYSGHIDVLRTSTITEQHSMSGKKILPIFVEEWRDIDIDSPRELQYAHIVLDALRKQGKEPWEDFDSFVG